MARLKEFSPEQALSAAVQVFWDRGYEKTSLDVLMSEMGVARQSLYDTFGDKRALYLSALAQYRDANQAGLRRLFASGKPIRECFAEILLGICSGSKTSLERGCLLLSANLERNPNDHEIAQLLKQNQAAIEAIFLSALKQAQAGGDLPADRDPEALAQFFVVTIQGMRASARINPDRKALRQVAQVALATLS